MSSEDYGQLVKELNLFLSVVWFYVSVCAHRDSLLERLNSLWTSHYKTKPTCLFPGRLFIH